MTLYREVPTGTTMVSGAVKSWKTEQIGFEVGGRVRWVLEPGKEIERRITGPEGWLIKEGTPLAQIDPTSSEVAVETARSRYDVAVLEKGYVGGGGTG